MDRVTVTAVLVGAPAERRTGSDAVRSWAPTIEDVTLDQQSGAERLWQLTAEHSPVGMCLVGPTAAC